MISGMDVKFGISIWANRDRVEVTDTYVSPKTILNL